MDGGCRCEDTDLLCRFFSSCFSRVCSIRSRHYYRHHFGSGGAVIARAAVEAKNVATGAVYPAASSATGNYTIAQLPAGNYELT